MSEWGSPQLCHSLIAEFFLQLPDDISYVISKSPADVAGQPFHSRQALTKLWIHFPRVAVCAEAYTSFVLGRVYPHGVWFYFPVALAIKSGTNEVGPSKM